MLGSRVVARAAALLDQRLAFTVHGAVIRLAIVDRHPGSGPQPVRDLDQIRTFLTGAGPIAMVDLPWIPVFLAICFLIHPWLGLVATGGGIVLFAMTLQNRAREPCTGAAGSPGCGNAIGDGRGGAP
jgi:ATP-binding cassette subfamily C protein